jgi:hypothetical protein
VYRANRILAVGFVALGIVILAATVIAGGGQVGFLIGAVYVALGVLRLRAYRQPPPG